MINLFQYIDLFLEADYILDNTVMGEQLEVALDLMRRLPPQRIDKNLADLLDLLPDCVEDLLSSVDQPLRMLQDSETGKFFLLCDYNRDGDSYRSPWSNKYYPEQIEGNFPNERLRELEIETHQAFDQYREMYYEGGISSVYLWDQGIPNQGFAGVILIKNYCDESKRIKGCWDSIHVFEAAEKDGSRSVHYKLISTVMLWLETSKKNSGTMNLGGSLTRQIELDAQVTDLSSHIPNIGKLVEDMENKIRNTLNEIYFGKTNSILNGLRSLSSLSDQRQQDALRSDLANALQKRRNEHN